MVVWDTRRKMVKLLFRVAVGVKEEANVVSSGDIYTDKKVATG